MKKLLLKSCLVLVVMTAFTGMAYAGQSVKLSDSPSGVTLLNQDQTGLTLKMEIESLDFSTVSTREGPFILLSVDDFTRSHKIGEPNIPMAIRLLSIPFDCELKTEVLDYEIEEISLADLGLTEPLMPVQPSLSKSQDPLSVPFEYDRSLYQKSGYYGLPLTETEITGVMRSLRLGKIMIAPIEYNPTLNTIRVYKHLTVKVDFLHPDWSLTQNMWQRYYSPVFDPVYSQIINYERLPSVILNDLVKYPIKYVIISDRMFESQLQPFIAWKVKKGFTVITAYTDEIGYNNTAIRNYIHGLYYDCPPEEQVPSFVLLVGDDQQIPAFDYGDHISDLDFCEFTNDDIPEIYYGRFSAEEPSHLQPQIDKTLEYEQYLMLDPSYLGEVTMIAGVDASHAPTWGNGQINYGTTYYFNPAHGITSHTWLYPDSDAPGAPAAIIQTVNDGIGYINYTAHGGHSGWSNPAFSSGDVDNLTNANKYPLAVGNCCLTNTFGSDYSTPCFGEAWLRAENKGAIGYIGGSDGTYWDEDYWWGVGFGPISANPTYEETGIGAYDGVFHDHGEPVSLHYVVNDALIFCGNMAVEESGSIRNDYYWEIYHLMGDPSITTYLGMPLTNNIFHDATVLVTATSFTVQADPGSYAGISVNGVLHGAAYIDSVGIVDVPLTPFDAPGTADIVITAQNRVPYIFTIQVITPEGPYVIYDSCSVNDIAGNNNGLVDCGENILLGTQLINVGPDDAIDVEATLSTADSFVTITDNAESYGTIPGENGTAYIPDAFAFDVAGTTPDGHNIVFELEVTGTALDTWVSNFTLRVHAPILGFISVTIDDASGNGNGILDPDETADLVVTLENTGSALAQSVDGILSEDDAFVSIIDGDGYFGDIDPDGGSSDNSGDVFVVSADSSCPMGHDVTFGLELTAEGGYSAAVDFNIIVGDREVIFADDFSSNQGWTGIGGPAEWTIGIATGGSGSDTHGGPDPAEDHSPGDENQVLGNDLTSGTGGDYNSNISSTYWITSPIIDCTDYLGVIITYYRWLGVERNNYDHAYFQAFDGTSWVTLFENPSDHIDESSWNEKYYDLSVIADENPDFQIRYGLGTTDGSWQYCGWNIDDIEIKGYYQATQGNPELLFDPTSISDSLVQGDIVEHILRIYNNGDGTLRVRFSSIESWLEFSTEQNYIAPYDSLDFTVNINTTDLGPGEYNGSLNYSSNDSDNPSGSIPVNVHIHPPHISVDQTAIGDTLEGGEQSTVPLVINNDGPGRLSYSINCETFDILLQSRRSMRSLVENIEPLGFRPADPDKSKGDEPYFPPVISGSGGPDMFGYTWIDSDEPGGPTYEWIDISGYGTPVTLDDDNWVGPIPMEFNFPFYENSYSEIFISSNGFFTFGSGHSDITNTTIPNSSEPNNLLSIWWDDLNPSSGGDVYYFYDGDNNVFIISFVDVPNYHYSGGGTGSLTFQAILYSSGKILFQYEVMEPGSDYDGLEGATVGIENASGTDGLQVVYNAAYMHDYLAIKFSAARWLSVEPDAGWIEPFSSDTVDVMFDATELEDGDYYGQVTISSNDPDTPTLEIPVTLFVGAIPGCDYIPGDVNGDDEVTGSDVTYSVLYFKGLGNPPPDSCWDGLFSTWLYAGGDVNGNCQFTGSDVSFLVAYFKGYNPELQYCPRIPPIGPMIAKPVVIKQEGLIQKSSGEIKNSIPLRKQ